MRDTGVVLRYRVLLRLLTREEGGRSRGIASGYRPSWRGPRKPDHNDAEVRLDDAGELEPGNEAAAWVTPFADDLWIGRVDVGDELEMLEGNRLVGRAKVTGSE